MLVNRRYSSSEHGSALRYGQDAAGAGANVEWGAIGQRAAGREGCAVAPRDHDAIESDYWHGDNGQFSNPFLCRS
jgi:hypothetical protein